MKPHRLLTKDSAIQPKSGTNSASTTAPAA